MIPKEISDREALVENSILRSDRTDDGALVIYTYTDKCAHERAWDEITMNSRGHIFDVKTGECVARPFRKFFNLDENEMSKAWMFDWGRPHQFFVKLDGWLGTLYRHNGQLKVASRGSFHSTGALWGTKWLNEKCRDLNVLSSVFPNMTLVFEIIEPSHRIILDHGDARLVILAAFDRITGEEINRFALELISDQLGIPIVDQIEHMTFEKAIDIQKKMTGTEGFVVRFEDGRRVKIKTDWYMNIARFLQHLSPISVWEAMSKDLNMVEFYKAIPPELIPTAQKIEYKLRSQYAEHDKRIMAYCDKMIKKHGFDRKQIALNQECDRHDPARAAVFCAIDEQWERLRGIVMDSIYPKANQYVEET